MGRILDQGLGSGQTRQEKPPVPNLCLNCGGISPEIIRQDTQKGGRGEAAIKLRGTDPDCPFWRCLRGMERNISSEVLGCRWLALKKGGRLGRRMALWVSCRIAPLEFGGEWISWQVSGSW